MFKKLKRLLEYLRWCQACRQKGWWIRKTEKGYIVAFDQCNRLRFNFTTGEPGPPLPRNQVGRTFQINAKGETVLVNGYGEEVWNFSHSLLDKPLDASRSDFKPSDLVGRTFPIVRGWI